MAETREELIKAIDLGHAAQDKLELPSGKKGREPKSPNDMSREELRALVWDMSAFALDLAQHLSFTNEWLKIQYKKDAYERASEMASRLVSLWDYDHKRNNAEIAILGEGGLVVKRGSAGELLLGEDQPQLVGYIRKENEPYSEIERAFMEIESYLPTREDIETREKALKFWRDTTEKIGGKKKIEVSVRSLRKMMLPMEIILDVCKNVRLAIEKSKQNS